MAKPGVYKSEVKKARDSLIAQGKHPSVDAVRIALGNTGSKTTIHKYLKELDEEGGGVADRKASISEALQDLVERLAAQLQDEANARIDAVRAEQAEQARQHAEALAAAQRDAAHWRDEAQQLDAALADERDRHGTTREALQRETIARHTAEQRAEGLDARLAENEAHRRSLEDKHRHAYEALDHYRQSAKEQRDQDERRHEQQIQHLQAELRATQQTIIVKQEDVTRLNQEGARLVADLSHARSALHEEQERSRQLAHRLEALPAAEQHAARLEAQLADKEARLADVTARLQEGTAQVAALNAQVRDLQLDLAAAKAGVTAQQDIVAALRADLDARAA